MVLHLLEQECQVFIKKKRKEKKVGITVYTLQFKVKLTVRADSETHN